MVTHSVTLSLTIRTQATIVALIIRYHEVSDALAPYTAVDSDEVLQRIQASLMPWHTQAPATIARIHRRPDVKGPACSLLTVLLLSTLVHRGEGWSSDDHTHLGWMLLQLAHLAQGVAMLVLYVIVVSGAVWAWCRPFLHTPHDDTSNPAFGLDSYPFLFQKPSLSDHHPSVRLAVCKARVRTVYSVCVNLSKGARCESSREK